MEESALVGDRAGSDPALHLNGVGAAITGVHRGGKSGQTGALTGVQGQHQHTHRPTSGTTQTLLLQHGSPLVQRCHCREGEEHTLREGKEVAQTPPSGIRLQTLGPDTDPNRAVMTTEHRSSPRSYLALPPPSPSPSPPTTKVIPVSALWGRHDQCSLQIQLSC